ncbi:MAG: right-handed parallel beta-helix repeat-containing protein [Candidatus Thorarchaeota archaeon]
MGQAVKNSSRVCPLPPGPLKEASRHMRPRTIFMAVGLSFILTTSLMYYLMLPPALPISPLPPTPPTPLQLTPHGAITIVGDANFTAIALLEGWPGDGSPEDPFIIDGLEIDLGGELRHCIFVCNTRVSFTISNCNLTGSGWVGILLENVTNGELVNNTCTSNGGSGITLYDSDYNTVANNTCTNNGESGSYDGGIYLRVSDSNTVANNTCSGNDVGIYLFGNSNTVVDNTCNNNTNYGILLPWGFMHTKVNNTVVNNICTNNRFGIFLRRAQSNTVANNTCKYNWEGIMLYGSDSNTVANNICNDNNDYGIRLNSSDSNTVTNNTCNYNRVGICIQDSHSNIVVDNTCMGNTEHDITGVSVTGADDSEVALLIVFAGFMGYLGITFLGAGLIVTKLPRFESKGE